MDLTTGFLLLGVAMTVWLAGVSPLLFAWAGTVDIRPDEEIDSLEAPLVPSLKADLSQVDSPSAGAGEGAPLSHPGTGGPT